MRGNGRAGVFLAPDDYARFMEQLDAALEADGIVLCAWVAPYLGYGSESAVGKARKRAQAALAQVPEFADAERKLLKRLSAERNANDGHDGWLDGRRLGAGVNRKAFSVKH